LITLEKAVKAAMVPAGTARADFGREVPAFDVDATAVELEFQKLYSYLFDFENMIGMDPRQQEGGYIYR
ncbi:hypothetical protein Tco_0084671, partial [Tanacetum coccineum]